MDEIIYPDHLKSNLLNLLQNNTARIEESFGISLALRGNKIMFDGHTQNQKKFKLYMNHIMKLSTEKGELSASDLDMSLSMVEEDKMESIPKELDKKIKIIINGKEVAPKTFNQKEYLKAILNNDMAFGIGPAGTGKTFLAIAIALHHLLTKKVERIVLTRPVVEAGEKLGFLPGDIQQKVNPYFRPLYDALYHLIGFEKTAELIDKEIIEIAPLAYMRGRTIDNAFIILDEGQNTLNSQMKMFLTRFGQNSKVVVTADVSQIDLPEPGKSGIFRAIKILKNVRGIKIINLTKHDVVRHPLVQKIIDAYDLSENEKK
ncbi:MAG: PhoH family protein [Acidobacteria bacterium]|jgi:phosphate starvation-inducible PhoH-like protein|nr:PhoH family protein [Acidobacteriota bacterium]